MKSALVVLVLGMFGQPTLAADLTAPLRPIARGESAVQHDVRPQLRPIQASFAFVPVPQNPGVFPDTSLFPFARPDSLEQKILFGKRKKKKGSVCDNIEIQGEPAGNIPGKLNGCGIKDAVRITSVSGIALSQASLMNCETAQSLNTWVEKSVIPTFRQRGPVVQIKVAGHYTCRTRNHQPGGRISEHGKGKAIDISAFTMMDGEVITVLEGWKRGSPRRLLQKVWKGACGPFGTVLGPESDRYHQDHFHMDTASYRSGSYCR